MVDVDVCISSHLKEELAWAVDKRLRVISTLKNSKTTKELKELAVLNLKQHCIRCRVALSNVFQDSVYCDFLHSLTELILAV